MGTRRNLDRSPETGQVKQKSKVIDDNDENDLLYCIAYVHALDIRCNTECESCISCDLQRCVFYSVRIVNRLACVRGAAALQINY